MPSPKLAVLHFFSPVKKLFADNHYCHQITIPWRARSYEYATEHEHIIVKDEWQAAPDLLSFLSILLYLPALRLLVIFCGCSQEGWHFSKESIPQKKSNFFWYKLILPQQYYWSATVSNRNLQLCTSRSQRTVWAQPNLYPASVNRYQNPFFRVIISLCNTEQ